MSNQQTSFAGKKCTSCDKINLPKNSFCSECGVFLLGKNIFCNNCSKALKPEAKFCPDCGVKFELIEENNEFDVLQKFKNELQPTIDQLLDFLSNDAEIPMKIDNINLLLQESMLGVNLNLKFYPTIQTIMGENVPTTLSEFFELNFMDDFTRAKKMEEIKQFGERKSDREDNPDFLKLDYFYSYMNMHRVQTTGQFIMPSSVFIPINLAFYILQKYPKLLQKNFGDEKGKERSSEEMREMAKRRMDLLGIGKKLRDIVFLYTQHLHAIMQKQWKAKEITYEQKKQLMREMCFCGAILLNLPTIPLFQEVKKILQQKMMVNGFFLDYHDLLLEEQKKLIAQDVVPGSVNTTYIENALSIRLNLLDFCWEKEIVELFEQIFTKFYSDFKKTGLYGKPSSYSYIERLLNTVLKNTKDKEIKRDSKFIPYIVLSLHTLWNVTQREDFYDKGKRSIEYAQEIIENLILKKPYEFFDSFVDHASIFHVFEILAYIYKKNQNDLFINLDETLKSLEKFPKAKNIFLLAVNKGLFQYYIDHRDEGYKEYGDKMIELFEPKNKQEQEVLKSVLEHNSLVEIGFVGGTQTSIKLPEEIKIQLDDDLFAKKGKLTFEFYPLATSSKTMGIYTTKLVKLMKLFSNEQKGEIKQAEKFSPDDGILAVLTKDKKGQVDGVLFLEDKRYTTDSNYLLFYGIATSVKGELSKKEISLAEYIKKWEDPNMFEITKNYSLNITDLK